MSPKSIRKDRGRQLRSKRDKADSPSSKEFLGSVRGRSSSASQIYERIREAVKEALSPSVAECLRAVFAAFLWHEGIVHDAMACASFIKFHPDLQKEMSKFAHRTKHEKSTRARHATESSKDNKRRENMNLNEARVRFKLEAEEAKGGSEKDDAEGQKKDGRELEKLKEGGSKMKKPVERHKSEGSPVVGRVEEREESPLPPTLHHLVYFWEELSTSVLKVISQDLVYPSPAVTLKAKRSEKKEKEKDKEKKGKKKKEEKQHLWRENAIGKAMAGLFAGGGEGERGETQCELCGGMYPHPVTYHMRQAHPGCGRHAGGKGYNSSGNFCGGWAGNCGEGGFGGSSWYLICERCREKCLKEKRQSQKEKEKSKKLKKKSSHSRQQTVVYPQEPHSVLKSNAMFLLDLSSASDFTLPTHLKKQNTSDLFLPSVSEEYGMELNPFPSIPFQYLKQQGGQSSDTAFAEDFYIDADERVFVRSCSVSAKERQVINRPRLPTEPRHSPLARSGSLGQDVRPHVTHISPPSPRVGVCYCLLLYQKIPSCCYFTILPSDDHNDLMNEKRRKTFLEYIKAAKNTSMNV